MGKCRTPFEICDLENQDLAVGVNLTVIEVYLDDSDCKNFLEPDRWARECCNSYRGVTVTDISDLSYTADEVAVYTFGNSADAAFFTMRWKAA